MRLSYSPQLVVVTQSAELNEAYIKVLWRIRKL